MCFSLLTMIVLIALVAIELFTLKNPSSINATVLNYLVYSLLLSTTLGAICVHGRLQKFCQGYAILAWACIIYGFVTTTSSILNDVPSPLAKSLAKTFLTEEALKSGIVQDPFGAATAPDPDPFANPFQANAPVSLYLRLWHLWAILNVSMIGGIAALQIRSSSAVMLPQPVKSSSVDKQLPPQ
jgi:hypothetical protein